MLIVLFMAYDAASHWTHRAALLVLHGLGGNRSGDLALVREAELGYGVLVLDLRAHGESDGTVSTLSFHEVRDVRAATHYLQGRAEVDPALALLAAACAPQSSVPSTQSANNNMAAADETPASETLEARPAKIEE